jgi:ACS family D-galactonate transporter-like MFS transporter
MSSSGLTVISEIAPRSQLGLVSALQRISQIVGHRHAAVIGAILQATGSFFGALAFVGGVALVGALSWIFLIGDIRPIEMQA